jgi:hypothetical protein
MRDDQTLDPKNGAAKHPDRSDDTPSSDSASGEERASARLMNQIGDLRSRSQRKIDELCGVSRVKMAELKSIELPSPPQVREWLGRRTPVQIAVTTGVVGCLALGAVVEARSEAPDPAASRAEIVQRAQADQSATRSMGRTEAQPGDAAAAQPRDAAAPQEAPQQPQAAPLPPGHVESGPVAGLSGTQMDNAKAIVWTGVDMGMPRRALVIAVATAMQESELLNRASEVLPESKNHPHQGTGWDHDSVGLFQQRTSTGWGPVDKLMDPAYASAQFYGVLVHVPGWQQMRLTDAAQAVQVSAFPEHYAKHEGQATEVVNALTNVP